MALWLALLIPTSHAGVVINEFLPNPNGGDADNEWLELHNNGATPVDVSNWQLQWGASSYNNSFTIPAATPAIQPGGYLVIGGSNTGADIIDDLNLGNNSTQSDAVRLRDDGSVVIDTVVYGSDNSNGNWDSDNETPAVSLAPEQQEGMTIARVPNGVDTDFSGTDFQLTTGTQGADNGGGSGGSGDTGDTDDTDDTDVTGDTGDTDTDSATSDTSDTGDTGSGPMTGDIVINEFLVDPSSGSNVDGQWIELKNNDSVPIDLAGWTIERAKSTYSSRYTFGSYVLQPGEYVVVGGSNVGAADLLEPSLDFGTASSSGDAVRIKDPFDAVIDTVVYGDNNSDGFDDDAGPSTANLAPKPGGDESLGRVPDGSDTDDSSTDFAVFSSPTLGVANDAIIVDTNDTGPDPETGILLINEIATQPTGGEWIELCNPSGAAVNLSEWTIERATSSYSVRYTFPSYVLMPGDYVQIGEPGVSGADLNLPIAESFGFGNASSSGDAVRLVDPFSAVIDTVIYGPDNADGFLDDDGTVTTSIAPAPGSGETTGRFPDCADTNQSGDDFQLWTVPTPSAENEVIVIPTPDVVINEFVPNPVGSDTGFEWIELKNNDSVPVDLTNYRLQKITSSSASTMYTFLGTVIQPGEYLVVGDEFVTDADLLLPAGDTLSIPNASGSGDLIRLVTDATVPVDVVVYGPNNDDELVDESGGIATSIAPQPSEGRSLARFPDGTDTDLSGDDFQLTNPTVGAENEGVVCVTLAADVDDLVINEFFPAPVGDDIPFEWVELYYGGNGTIDLSGWQIASGSSSFDKRSVLPQDTVIGSGDFLVVGQSDLPEVDVVAAGFELSNASSSGDGVRLEDCAGDPVDTVIYGPDNDDEFIDDDGVIATSVAPKPKDDIAIMRIADGVDTNQSGDDFVLAPWNSPGESNPDCAIGAAADVKINEFIYNPNGSDEGQEWVELYNAGNEDMDLRGWELQKRTGTSWSEIPILEWEGSYVLKSGKFLLIGGELVQGTDLVPSRLVDDGNGGEVAETRALGLGGATSSGDAVRIVDCTEQPVDTVVYGQPNSDLIEDDSGEVAESLAPPVSEGQSLQRVEDGFDTDLSGQDFAGQSEPSPGQPNAELEPTICVPNADSGDAIRLNEFLANPDGSDAGFEWIELYNTSDEDVSVAGWFISAETSGDYDDTDAVMPGGAIVPAKGFYLIGDAAVPETDVFVPMSLGNGDGGDGIRLYDCSGDPVDTVVYGDEENADEEEGDQMVDDRGVIVEVPLGKPGDGFSGARIEDGVDTQEMSDWFLDNRPTPGATNFHEPSEGGDPETPGGGCSCRSGAPDDGSAPDQGAKDVDPNARGCATTPIPTPLKGMEFFLALITLVRRKRRD